MLVFYPRQLCSHYLHERDNAYTPVRLFHCFYCCSQLSVFGGKCLVWVFVSLHYIIQLLQKVKLQICYLNSNEIQPFSLSCIEILPGFQLC